MSNDTNLETRGPATSEPTGPERTRGGFCVQPPVDILESADELLLVADLPGVAANEVNINFEDGELTIHGPVRGTADQTRRFLLREYGVADYLRSFRVSEQIDASRIHAEHRDGVLMVHLPKVEALKPRRIQVAVG